MKKIDKELSNFLTNKREKNRLKNIRKNKKKNNNIIHHGHYTSINIIMPELLDIQENRKEFSILIDKIRDVILNKRNFRLDHRKLKSITEEALLLLASEIERCTNIMGIKLRADHKFFPKDPYIGNLLNKIGYWDHFKINKKKYKPDNRLDSKLYLKIVSDTKVSGEKIGDLIIFFENLINFDTDIKDKFSDALMEAAANTVEHAYTEEQTIKTIKTWWLTASLNKSTKEISFIFYDQGVGILNTLESKQRHVKLKRLVGGWVSDGLSKGGILKKLITTNLSSYKDERRGNGLMSFKNFIDEVEGGELTIYTDNVSYSAISDKIYNHTGSLNGTLIVWKIKANENKENCIYIKGSNCEK